MFAALSQAPGTTGAQLAPSPSASPEMALVKGTSDLSDPHPKAKSLLGLTSPALFLPPDTLAPALWPAASISPPCPAQSWDPVCAHSLLTSDTSRAWVTPQHTGLAQDAQGTWLPHSAPAWHLHPVLLICTTACFSHRLPHPTEQEPKPPGAQDKTGSPLGLQEEDIVQPSPESSASPSTASSPRSNKSLPSAAPASPSCENMLLTCYFYIKSWPFFCPNPPVAPTCQPYPVFLPSLHRASCTLTSYRSPRHSPPATCTSLPSLQRLERPCLTALGLALDLDLSSPRHVPGSLPTSFQSCFKS